MIVNIVLYTAAVLLPPLLIVLALRGIRIGRSIAERRRTPEPPYPPIERLAADLRRVHRDLVELPSDAPALRRRAAEQAYDDLLSSACKAVEVPHRLHTVSARVDREVERLRVEEALREAGLRIP